MLPIGEADIQRRIERDNFWWTSPQTKIPEADLPRRVYFESFKALALDFKIRRAAILLGPRRVGKTVMVKQLIHEAISEGFPPQNIFFASIDTPVYSGMSLEKFLGFIIDLRKDSNYIVLFDEIQYLKDWEIHLKDLVDNYPNIKFVATGSAAAALRLKSQESGAGRFSDFMLPPLTFYEFLLFIEEDHQLMVSPDGKNGIDKFWKTNNIDKLNSLFVDYLNYGGYPEAVSNKSIRDNPEQFIRNDIIDKVLLKDLPSLYGIDNITELNKLFTVLAYNAGHEASLEKISKESGISKPTIRRYMEYLESAFLIIKISNVDENCKSMKRERNFKIYLNNPSMRAALFSPVDSADSAGIGHLAECAIFSQWQHSTRFRDFRYARWRNEGEVDIVFLGGATQKPLWVGEIKWSDRIKKDQTNQLYSLRFFLSKHPGISNGFFTTKSQTDEIVVDDRIISILPSAVYCYTVGRNVTSPLSIMMKNKENSHEDDA